MPTCHRVRKPIKVGVDKREPGDLVPEALQWKGHVLARLEHTFFIERTTVLEGELEAALSYCEPEVWELHGFKASDAEAAEKARAAAAKKRETPREKPAAAGPEAEAEAAVEALEVAEEVVAEEPEPEMLEEPEPLISEVTEVVPPVRLTAEQLEAMPWPELRKLGHDAGLDQTAKKADIIAHLTEG